jgi:hypothetical protein
MCAALMMVCGGACSSSTALGTINVYIDEGVPAARLIPANTTTVVVTLGGLPSPQIQNLSLGGTLGFTPDGSATTFFTNLPYSSYSVTVQAEDANGDVLASGTAPYVVVNSLFATNVSISLASAVVSAAVTLNQTMISTNGTTTAKATLTCYSGANATGSVVPVAPGKITWSSDNNSVVMLTTNADGTCTVAVIASAAAGTNLVTITGMYSETSTAAGGTATATATSAPLTVMTYGGAAVRAR